MEFGLREYLLILGSVLIVGLLADGIRRTIKHRRQGLKLDLMASPPESPEPNDVSAPRPAKRPTAAELEPQLERDPLLESTDTSQLNLWASDIKPETMKAAEPDLWASEPDVPLDQATRPDRLDTVDASADAILPDASAEESDWFAEPQPVPAAERQEPSWGDASIDFDDDGVSAPRPVGGAAPSEPEEPFVAKSPEFAPEPEPESAPEITPTPRVEEPAETPSAHQTHDDDMAILADGPQRAPIEETNSVTSLKHTVGRLFGFTKSRDTTTGTSEALPTMEVPSDEVTTPEVFEGDDGIVAPARPVEPEPEPNLDDIVLVELKPARSDRFVAVNLHTACLRAGLRKTEQGLYQRIPLDQSAAPLFTLVNSLEPGTFETDAKSVDSPGFFVFAELSKQVDPVFAVNELISGARSIAREIGGDVYDEAGVAISKEWIDLARARAGHQQLLRP